MPVTPKTANEPATTVRELRMTAHRGHAGLLWAASVVLALVLNLSLFGFMPRLIGRVPGHLPPASSAWPVNIVHLRPDKPPPPAEQKPRARQKATAPRAAVRPSLAMPRFTPRLPAIDLRPQLPPLPTDLPTLTLQTVPLDPAAIPSQSPLKTAPPPGGRFTEGQLDGPLVPLSRVPPVYPLVARHKRIEGWVKVKFLVTRRGTVERVTIVESHPPGVFDRAVLRAVSSWRFKPGTVGGRTVDAWAQSTLEFKLK